MGRVKLKIKRLESINWREATYEKRKPGIMKKAGELSILCDIDLILLMFSPSGQPSLCTSKSSSIGEIIAKFSELTPQERAKRKLEKLVVLKKIFKKLDHDVNIEDLLSTSTQTIEAQDLTNQSSLLQIQLAQIHKRQSFWSNPNEIINLEHLGQMEDSVRDSLNQIRTHKFQFQNETNIPFRMGVEQQLQLMSWIPNNESGHLVFPEDANMIPQSSGKNSEISNSGPENGILNSLSASASLRLQLGGQCPYMPYNLDMLQENPIGYHIDPNFEPPAAGFDPSAIAIFEECLYPPQSN